MKRARSSHCAIPLELEDLERLGHPPKTDIDGGHDKAESSHASLHRAAETSGVSRATIR